MSTSSELRSKRLEAVLPLQHLRQQIDSLLSEVQSGTRRIDSVFGFAEADLASDHVYVVKLVEVVPGIGKIKARQLLDDLHIDHTEHVGELDESQRSHILQQINSMVVA
jgi:hypothetical protein